MLPTMIFFFFFFLEEKEIALWILFTLSPSPGLFKFNIVFLNILLVLVGIVPNSGFTGLNTVLYIYIYIYIYILPTPTHGYDVSQGQFLSEVNRFEFRVFLLLDWFPKKPSTSNHLSISRDDNLDLYLFRGS